MPHSTQNSAMFWLVASPGWLKYIAVSKPIPPQPMIATFSPTGALSLNTSR